MRFTEALRGLSLTERALFNRKLVEIEARSGLGKRVADNVRAEEHLDKIGWKALFDAVLRAATTDAAERELVTAAKTVTLRGRAIGVTSSFRFGRAVTIDNFCRTLHDQHAFGSIAAARVWLTSAVGQPLAITLAAIGPTYLSRFLMWATFDAAMNGAPSDPFNVRPSNADNLRSVLGLSEDDLGKPLILLEYDLPHPARARVPTIADAYAGGFSYYFQASSRKAVSVRGYATTLPWPTAKSEPPRPEVVHERLNASVLRAPIALLP